MTYTAVAFSHFFFNHPIKPNESTKFKFRVIRVKEEIAIGVKEKITGKFMGYRVSSIKEPEGVKEGSGFMAGDIVEVQVDRA